MVNVSDADYEGFLPDTAVTVRGTEYYFAVEDSARNMRTFPATNEQTNPQMITVTSTNLDFASTTPAKAYRMISIPFDLNDKSVESVLGDDFLGSYDQIQWRLLRFANGLNVEFGRQKCNHHAEFYGHASTRLESNRQSFCIHGELE